MSVAPGMAIAETMIQVVARASLDSLAGEAVSDLNPDLTVLEAARQGRGNTCRHCFTCGSADHFMANCRMTGGQGNEISEGREITGDTMLKSHSVITAVKT